MTWEGRLLAVVTAVLVVFGLAAVYGASSLVTVAGGQVGASFALRQAVGAAVGGLLAIVFARLDYHRWRQWAWPLLGVTVLLLLIPLLPFTHPITPTINGARRWVNLGFLTLQPSELAKFAVVFTAGARIGHFLALGVASTPLLFGAVATAQYRMARVLTFLNPGAAPQEATWQVQQSLTGIGAGQLLGAGFGQGQQKLGYLPYAYSDFIFSTIGEEWGFLGVLAIALLFGTFVWLGFRIARNAPDPFGQLLATGISVMIGLSVVLHIGVSLAVIPATGVTLPFMSYGRSSLIVALAATGVLASVGRARRVS